VLSPYGTIRRLPYLLVQPSRDNRDINMGRYSNLLNICLNSPVQNMESIIMNRAFIKIGEWAEQSKEKLLLHGQIHDAQEYYTLIKDWIISAMKVHEISEQDYPEYDGIPLEVESNFSDYFDKNELWDMGKKFDTKKLKQMAGT
jgi:DNA polymerase I-like protein with 3'-5' exonuclease and polymerase domains